jgi:hypothetical protein
MPLSFQHAAFLVNMLIDLATGWAGGDAGAPLSADVGQGAQ